MRVKFQEYGMEFPTLLAVTKVTAYQGDDVFKIIFHCGEDKKLIISKRIFGENDVAKARKTFASIQTSLGLSGYVNLIDEATDWEIKGDRI